MSNPPTPQGAVSNPHPSGRDDLDSALADLEVSLGANDADLEKMVSVSHCERCVPRDYRPRDQP